MLVWHKDGKKYARTLDKEDEDDTNSYYTFPFVSDSAGQITYTLSYPERITNFSWYIEKIGLSQTTKTYAFGLSDDSVHAANTESVPGLIKRSEWWADESLRYWNDESLEKKMTEWRLRDREPLQIQETETDTKNRLLEEKRFDRIKSIRWDAASIVSLTRYENGKKLLWPIKKTKKIDRIILHHTAENLDQDTDDATLIRAIYYYHARTRGWWDIGYNYIVGQRWQVYEGRAWGDYVEGAHAYANNLGSVWVSVIGNYEHMNLNRDQRKWLEDLLVILSKKYGINVTESTTGVRTCKNGSSECLFDESLIKRLHGHRDVGYTSCPGTNLYNTLWELRETIVSKVWNITPVLNTEIWKIDPVPPEDALVYVAFGSTSTIKKASIPTVRPGKPIKIKLSYPHTGSIDISSIGKKSFHIQIGNRRINSSSMKSVKVQIDKNQRLLIDISWKKYRATNAIFTADILRIDSWERIPAWDTKKQYNDNLFRGKIHVSVKDGKLLVINEIPIEYYLRWLWEVSNTDLEEKIKTITVAARSYARYYMNPKNRKYGTRLYDGSDDPDSFQRYLWYGYEARSPRVTEMVTKTQGEVITYQDAIIKAWYFSSSDGRTRSYREYCEQNGNTKCEDIPYLQSTDDPAWYGRTRFWHGVGISGIGATYFAQEWWNYKKIIQYFLKWVEIEKK